ncbi:MAG TPA: DUF929 family protein [Streptosporangiaceae bacterium]|nr:DUF929 family protein [Streptosporangiaceae bacterium]
MSSAQANSSAERAQEDLADQQATARRAPARRRGLIAAGSVVIVLAIVVVLVILKSAGKTPVAPASPPSATRVEQNVTRLIASVPSAALNQVGVGRTYPAAGSVYPHSVQNVRPTVKLLTSGGKPQIVYVGADYCPFCAAERWALAVALSRFGTFSGLGLIHSSSTDEYPNTPTLSFYKATYSSKYLVFTATEAATVNRAPLQPLTPLDKTVMGKFDAPPYVPSSAYDDSFPFVDFANKYVIVGASYNPGLLAGLTWQQVAADLARPSSTVGAAIDAAANHITAAICKATNDQPANVCTSSGVTSASGSI